MEVFMALKTNDQNAEKNKALEAALLQIDKKFGKGSIMMLGDESARLDIEAVSTGSVSLDIACGIGGLPKGRIIEIFTTAGRCHTQDAFCNGGRHPRNTYKAGRQA